jgi:hypothetical protein
MDQHRISDTGAKSVSSAVPLLFQSRVIRHAVEVAASTLYEAAALAIGEFRRCGFTANAPGPATRLTVTVKTPATSHEVRLSKIEAWLESGGRSPNEQVLKVRLRELLGS